MADGWTVVSEAPAPTVASAPTAPAADPWKVVKQAPAPTLLDNVAQGAGAIWNATGIPAAVAKVGQDVQAGIQATKAEAQSPPKDLGGQIADNAASLGRTAGMIRDAAGVLLALPASVQHAVVGHIAGGISNVTGVPQPQIEDSLNKALMAVPGEGAVVGKLAEGVEAAGEAGAATAAAASKPPPPPGPLAPYRAAVSQNAAEQQAAQTIAARASDIGAVKANLAGGPSELVPASTPTTFQQTGDMGLGALEREQATKNPIVFRQAAADQNSARVAAFGTVQSGADPLDLAKTFRAQLDDISNQQDAAVADAQAKAQAAFDNTDQTTAAKLQAATQAAQVHAGALGGIQTPEAYGEALRGTIADAEDQAKAATGKLYAAVDPDKDLTANVTATKAAAQQQLASMRPTTAPMAAPEAAVFRAAAAMPPVAPFSDLVDLNQHVNGLMKAELRTAGATPTYARLSQLRGAIQDNLDNTIGEKIAQDDAAVQAGRMPEDESLRAQLQAQADEWRRARANPGRSDLADTGGRTATVRGPDGAASPSVGGLASAPGDQGLPSTPGSGGAPGAPQGQGLDPLATTTREPVATLRGDEVVPFDVDPHEVRAATKAWYNDNLRGKLVQSDAFGGREVGFASSGRDKATSNLSDPRKVQTFAAVPDVIAKGQIVRSEPSYAPTETNIRAYHTLEAPVQVGNRLDNVRVLVRENTNGHLYYDHVVEDGETAARPSQTSPLAAEGPVQSDRVSPGAQPAQASPLSERGLGQAGPVPGAPSSGAPEQPVTSNAGEPTLAPNAQGDGGSAPNIAPTSLTNQPTVDDAARQRLAAANAAYRERKATFGVEPVAGTLKTTGIKGQFVLDDGKVPARFFFPRPESFGAVQAALKASPNNLPILQDYAAMSLRRAAINEDGVLDPAKFAAWAKIHRDALRALPADTRARFENAASAGQAVADAGEARTQAMKATQAKAAADVARAVSGRTQALREAQRAPSGRVGALSEPEDVVRTVGTIMNSRTAAADMGQLVGAAKDNPEAMAGLRQAVADYMIRQLLSNTEEGTSGVNRIKADAFQSFVKGKQDVLAQVFSPDEMSMIRAIGADIQRSNRSIQAVKLPGQSNTAQDSYALGKAVGPRTGRAMLDFVGSLIGGALGTPFGGPVGAAAGAVGGAGASEAIQAFRMAGINRVDDLVTRAMLDPALARALLERVPTRVSPATAQMTKLRMRAIYRALGLAGATSAVSQAPQPTSPVSLSPLNALAQH